MKYVVVFELDNGYMDCVAVCDNVNEAYGHAYRALVDGLDSDAYYVALPNNREGDNGVIIELKDKTTDKALEWATVLFYSENEVTE